MDELRWVCMRDISFAGMLNGIPGNFVIRVFTYDIGAVLLPKKKTETEIKSKQGTPI